MEQYTLLKAGIKKHRGVLAGIFILILLTSLSLGAVLTVWTNSRSYISSELTRAGFGELTAWVSGVPDEAALAAEIAGLEDVARVETQNLVFSNYTANEQQSDSEGQLILFAPEEGRYRFFTDDLNGYKQDAPEITPGEVVVSPSLISMMGVKIGDTIDFSIARNGGTVALTVSGFYEDPFMGSSMIGMKGFLISEADYAAITDTIANSGIDALARGGSMLHVFQTADSEVTTAELNGILNETTDLPNYTEFVHSADAITGFMLILQNAFSGLLIAFVVILLAVVLIVLGHSITGAIEADTVNMGILKTAGFTSTKLRQIQLMQAAAAILPGMLIGIALTGPLSRLVGSMALTTTGIRIPVSIPWGLCLGTFAAVLLLLTAFVILKTAKIGRISPMKAIRGDAQGVSFRPQKTSDIDGKHLGISLAVRQLLTGKKKYVSVCIVAILLVFFASVIGRMDTWLGADGKGMMDAFNPADHDIGVQMFGEHTDEDARDIVLVLTDITDTYLLAMPGVAVTGIDYTANVITEPDRFHILEGRTSTAANEIVLTEFVAADLGVSIGDTLTVTGDSGSGEYIVSGIYSCANEMGANVGMNREGYLKIGRDDPQIWCHHYFLGDPTQKAAVTEALDAAFGGDVHVHENTWPGLFGIISAMQALVAFMYAMVLLFILIVTVMTGSKILSAEQRDIGIYKAIGFTDRQLRLSFSLRFGMVAALGSVIGVLLAAVFTDPLVSAVMKFAGISNFTSSPGALSVFFPAVLVTLLFMGFAYLAAGKIKRTDLTILITE